MTRLIALQFSSSQNPIAGCNCITQCTHNALTSSGLHTILTWPWRSNRNEFRQNTSFLLTLPSDALPHHVHEHLVLSRNEFGIERLHISSVMVAFDVAFPELPSPEFLVTASPQARPFGFACNMLRTLIAHTNLRRAECVCAVHNSTADC